MSTVALSRSVVVAPGRMPVFFSTHMVASSGSFSPSAEKPRHVVASWQALELPVTIIEPEPATRTELATAHATDHVNEVLACVRANGFGNRSEHVARTLPYTTGSMLSAARYVVAHGGAAAAPCSGFHHAAWACSVDYCTFNGLMVTACVLKNEGRVRRVGILDFDMHYGDGTDQIIDHLCARTWIEHYTAGAEYTHARQSEAFFHALPEVLARMEGCDIVLYQAGADPHVHDPLGGWLTTEQLRLRDAVVFEYLHARGIPVVWNLAGGYQKEDDGSIPKVLEIHDNTAKECVRVFFSGRTHRES